MSTPGQYFMPIPPGPVGRLTVPDGLVNRDNLCWKNFPDRRNDWTGVAAYLPETGRLNIEYLDPRHPQDDPAYVRLGDLSALDEAQRFPIDALPDYLHSYIFAVHSAFSIPTAFTAVAVLAVGAGLIGNRAQLTLKTGMTERPALWFVQIGNPGSGKSPALDLARGPLNIVQRQLEHEYRCQLAAWEQLPKDQRADTPRPRMESIFTTDTTTEALASTLERSPGLVVVADELTSWVAGMDKYRKGGDRAAFLSLWALAPVKVDRRGAPTIFVDRPTVSIIGGIQPDVLPTLRGDRGQDDGFLDRILPVWPAPTRMLWTEDELDPALIRAYEARMVALTRIGAGSSDPVTVRLTADAKDLYREFHDENAQNDDGFSRKLPRLVARLALVLHCLDDPDHVDRPLSAETMANAITLGEYFRSQHARMTLAIGTGQGGRATSSRVRLHTRILNLLTRADDGLTKTELRRGLGGKATNEDLDPVLDALVADGTATLDIVPTGGAPRRTYRLNTPEMPTERARKYAVDVVDAEIPLIGPGTDFVHQSAYVRNDPDDELDEQSADDLDARAAFFRGEW